MENLNTENDGQLNNTNMLGEVKLKVLQDLASSSTHDENIWLNGYLSAVIALAAHKPQEALPAKSRVNKITIVYGTETGNSKKLATHFAAKAKKNGINAKIVSLDQYRPNDLSREEYFFSIISTQGDGEPPEAAKKFYDHIHQNGFDLCKLKYCVLALGDTSYPLFCKSGEDVDEQLHNLGGSRLLPLQKCDVDYEEDANAWFGSPLQVLHQNGNASATATPIDLLDLLRIYPVKNQAQFKDVIGILEPITPRLYSIASSPEAHNGELHIIVAKDYFDINNEIKYCLTSDFLSHLNANTSLNFYLHPNAQFRMPEAEKDIIMIGPGTGIAPFRSFIAQRDSTGASGRNWLFFGEQHFITDFLYQTEIQSWLETGVLSKVNVPFSRDTREKVYVQHKMMK